MDARTPVDETSGPPEGRCASVLTLSFFGNPSSTHAHRRLSHSLLQTHGFSPRDPFDPGSLLSLLRSEELYLLDSVAHPGPHAVPAHAVPPALSPHYASLFPEPGPVPAHAAPPVLGSPASPLVVPIPEPDPVPAHAAPPEPGSPTYAVPPDFELRRCANLRLSRWRVRFPQSWDTLARRHDLASPVPLPATLGTHALRLIHSALDAEDAVFSRYKAALLIDIDDALSDAPARSVRAYSATY